MTSKEFNHLHSLKYFELCDYLKRKYGIINGDYFINDRCKNPNKKIKRSNEGLFIHHIFEYKYIDLSKTENALATPYSYQWGKNLVYCNYLEHILLHIRIVKEYLSTKRKMFVGIGGLINHMIPEIIDYINGYQYSREYMRTALSVIDDNLNYFCKLFVETEDLIFDKLYFWLCHISRFNYTHEFYIYPKEDYYRGIMTGLNPKFINLITNYKLKTEKEKTPNNFLIMKKNIDTFFASKYSGFKVRFFDITDNEIDILNSDYKGCFCELSCDTKTSFKLETYFLSLEDAKKINSYFESKFYYFIWGKDDATYFNDINEIKVVRRGKKFFISFNGVVKEYNHFFKTKEKAQKLLDKNLERIKKQRKL